MSIKIDNHFPDGDCIVIDTKKYQITISRDENNEVHVAVKRQGNYLPMQELILGKQ
jgi:hypothetical protein